ncbi:hypothetical protein ACFSE0_10700 [Ochrobactrum teleogrylli]|uniref:Uncharacterized protein n=1 Tax=Ochrobactrum teleogrylli TaxID=2479765 RepID=A0ABY2Y824_9HYPH|nr:hypothetical protein [[Ochrobactrum] teleogrylli]TNV17764.1 hypothetical protein FIC94_06205 [[Ochrobactrum] teleogrylli]
MGIELSTILKSIADELGQYDIDQPMPPHRFADVYAKLSLCSELATSMEMELTGFRLLEADRAGRAFMETEATKIFNAPVATHDGKVIRPDFGGRR